MIKCCDALAWLGELPDSSVDLVATDPPYGHGRLWWDIHSPVLNPDFWVELQRVCKRNAAIVMFAQGAFTAKLVTVGAKLWRYNLVWAKNKSGGFLNANRMPLRAHEDICVFYQALPTYNPQMTEGHAPQNWARRSGTGPNYGETEARTSRSGKTDRHPTSVLHFAVVNNDDPERFHPTQKPVDLMRWIVCSYSSPGELVIDPFAGSGATGVAALQEGREFRGCDSSSRYVEQALARLAKSACSIVRTCALNRPTTRFSA